jgi:PhnB protein
MISDEFPEMYCYGPRHLGGTTFAITLFFEDSDKVFLQAIAAGAQELSKVEDLYCGDRGGKLVDPFGHQWFIYTRKENITYEELKRRGEEKFRKH